MYSIVTRRNTLFLANRINLQIVRLETTAAYVGALANLKKDLKTAMLAKDNIRKTTIRNLLSSIKNKEIDSKKKDFDEFMLSDLFSKLISQRKDSIAEFIKNDRKELVAKEEQEMDIIKEYLTALPISSPKEVENKVRQVLLRIKESEGDNTVQLKQIFGKLDCKNLAVEWKTSQATIKSAISKLYKEIF
ncbi:related to Altered inheritance of mitochondria protein 41, mitochondrial [Saccharomycodes ludwigii]|uniref:Altered inheritance of mitochondria protein 41 n=1 Tax=Saccharomycodes ludwigii TaxID=36035 RepID=A0A376B5U8_9ASCO|nr:hypothetical protein SCDLUD_002099 [Saccharomycodes ludwigii]KAH3902281.1 hypothetical protein SCDLUD_002099 [Saccharomycodes ludwigii]SSD60077.1 related to Altered inheritance of mitochondria protein 41, mitochondrial [Saccharomycodes ludwigii]